MSDSVAEPGLQMSRSAAVTAAIYSVAQEGAALAGLLSAEAANLWKVVGTEGVTFDQILVVSKNAQNTLANVAEIENRLLGKLAALGNMQA